jgi:acyl-CoA thioesterase I
MVRGPVWQSLPSLTVLVLLAAAGCVPSEQSDASAKDTVAGGAAPASADIRADAMSGAAALASDSLGAGKSRSGSGVPAALLIGTSLTAGLGLDPNDAYPAVLQRMADSAGYGVRIVNAGLSGETSAGALRRLEWLLRERAELVMIETGANDGLRGLDIDSTRANLLAIVRTVKRVLPGSTVLLVQMEAPPNLGEDYTRRFRESYSDVARAEGIGLIPFILEGVAGDRRFNQGDGIHPTEEGARRVARNVWGALAPHLSRLAKVQQPS